MSKLKVVLKPEDAKALLQEQLNETVLKDAEFDWNDGKAVLRVENWTDLEKVVKAVRRFLNLTVGSGFEVEILIDKSSPEPTEPETKIADELATEAGSITSDPG